jgi:Ca2+-transporting ATPase
MERASFRAQVGPFRILLRQFISFLVLILIVAACVALALGERVDAIAIGLVVLLNAGLRFVQEWKAETALTALGAMLSPKQWFCAKVRSRRLLPEIPRQQF